MSDLEKGTVRHIERSKDDNRKKKWEIQSANFFFPIENMLQICYYKIPKSNCLYRIENEDKTTEG